MWLNKYFVLLYCVNSEYDNINTFIQVTNLFVGVSYMQEHAMCLTRLMSCNKSLLLSWKVKHTVLRHRRCTYIVRILVSYSPSVVVTWAFRGGGGSRFNSRPRDRLSLSIFRGFHQTLQANAGILTRIRPRSFCSTSFLIRCLIRGILGK
jgi:hypothetical protein